MDATYNGVKFYQAVDAIHWHPYPGQANVKNPEIVLAGIANIQAEMATRSISSMPLVAGEASWQTNTWLPDLDWEAGFVWRFYLCIIGNGVQGLYWYEYDNTATGTLYNRTTSTLYKPGQAYQTLVNNIVGKRVSPPSLSGTTYTVTVTDPNNSKYQGLIVWSTDPSVDCNSGCTTVAYTPGGQYRRTTNVFGAVASIAGNIQIGVQPLLLDNIGRSVSTAGKLKLSGKASIQ
jgi:hypothetical protein